MINDKHIILIDIDTDIRNFLVSKIDPFIIENENKVKIPILYADGEKWNLSLKNKAIYDKKNKLILPILLYRRNPNVSIDDQYPKLNILQNDTDSMFLINDKYDRISTYADKRLNWEKHERKTLRYLRIPTHVLLTYSIVVYTRFIEQANQIIEKFVSYNNTSYGDKFRHNLKISSISSDALVELDQNRLIKTEIELEVSSIILNKDHDHTSNTIKRPTITKLNVSFAEYDNTNLK